MSRKLVYFPRNESFFSEGERRKKKLFDPYVCRLYIYYVIVVCVCFVLSRTTTQMFINHDCFISITSPISSCVTNKRTQILAPDQYGGQWVNGGRQLAEICCLDIIFRQITIFVKVRVAFDFGLQNL